MSLKERIENNIVVWFFSALIAGFAAGFGAFQTILSVSNQETISKDKLNELITNANELSKCTTEQSGLKTNNDQLLIKLNNQNAQIEHLTKENSSLAKTNKTIQGGVEPSSHEFFLAYNKDEDDPNKPGSELIKDNRIVSGKLFYVFSKWYGLSNDGYYQWNFRVYSEKGKLIDEKNYPFVNRGTNQYVVFFPYVLKDENSLSKSFRFEISMNNKKYSDEIMTIY